MGDAAFITHMPCCIWLEDTSSLLTVKLTHEIQM